MLVPCVSGSGGLYWENYFQSEANWKIQDFGGSKKKGGKTFDGGSSWVWDVLLVLDVTGLCKAPTVYFNRLDTSRK